MLDGQRGSGQASSEDTDSCELNYHLQSELGQSNTKTLAHKQITPLQLLLSSVVSNFKQIVLLIFETNCSEERLSGDIPSNRVEPSGLNEELTLSCFLSGRFWNVFVLYRLEILNQSCFLQKEGNATACTVTWLASCYPGLPTSLRELFVKWRVFNAFKSVSALFVCNLRALIYFFMPPFPRLIDGWISVYPNVCFFKLLRY